MAGGILSAWEVSALSLLLYPALVSLSQQAPISHVALSMTGNEDGCWDSRQEPSPDLTTYLSIFTCLTLGQFIGGRHKIHFGSWESGNDVAELKSEHHEPAFHICSRSKNKDF